MTTKRETFTFDVCGRAIVFYMPIDGQILMLQRFRAQLTGAKDYSDEDKAKLMLSVQMKTLNVIDSLFADPGDRDWVEEQMIAGKVSILDLLPILSGGRSAAKPADDADVAPKKKAAKKAAAVPTPAARKAANRRADR
jgi:hypothetical protein